MTRQLLIEPAPGLFALRGVVVAPAKASLAELRQLAVGILVLGARDSGNPGRG